MKKISLILILAICILALASCSNFKDSSTPSQESTKVIKGKAKYIHFEITNILMINEDLEHYDFFYTDAEFEYINEHLIKITDADGNVGYHDASNLIYMEGVTFYD